MELVNSSVLCRFVLSLWAALLGAWQESRVGQAFRRWGQNIAACVRGSSLCNFLWRDGAVTRSWKGSITQRLLTWILNLPGLICGWIYRLGKSLWDGSLVFRGIGGLGGASYVALGLFLALMLMVPHDSWDNRYALFGAVAVFALFALGQAARPQNRLDMEDLGPHFTLFMGFVCFAFLGSLEWSLSLRFVGFYLAAFLFCLLIVSSVRRYEDLQTVAVLVVAGLTVAALYGCYQSIIGVEVVANQQDMSVNAGMPGRVYSFFDNPNNFAELIIMILPMTYALFLNAKTWKGKLCALFALGVGGIALAVTYSRSCYLGFVLATVVFLAFWNWRLIPVLVVLGLCCVPLLPETVYNRILTIGNTKDSSTNYRFAIYKASGVLMKDYWLRGVGLGSDILKKTFKGYPPMYDGNVPIHTHNNYLQVWAEMGLGGIITFLAAILFQLKTGVKAYVRGTDKRVKNLLSAAVAGFCGILLVSVAEYTWFYARNMFIYFFLFGFIAACAKLCRREEEPT